MSDPNNPYLTGAKMLGQMPQKPQQTPPAGMDPAKFQRQQQRTAIQNDRTAGQNMTGAPPVSMPQPLQVAGGAMGKMFDTLQGPPPSMGNDFTGVQGAPPDLVNQHFPGGVPQQPAPAPAPAPAPPMGGQIGGAPAQISRPLQRQPGGFNPKAMVSAVGQARGAQMEKMARPTGARQGFAQAKATGNLPGGPPKPPTAY